MRCKSKLDVEFYQAILIQLSPLDKILGNVERFTATHLQIATLKKLNQSPVQLLELGYLWC